MQPDMPSTSVSADEGVSDLELVTRCQGGDTRAFDALVTRYRGRVYAMTCHLVQNDSEAWDLAQEAFVKAWRGIGSFKRDSSFYTWMYRITHNVAYDWLRKKKFDGDGEFDDTRTDHRIAAGADAVPHGAPRPDDAMDNMELKDRIDRAIAQLSPDHRQTILLREIEGLCYHEIAEVMQCSLGTVMSRLFYARRKLQELLRDAYETDA